MLALLLAGACTGVPENRQIVLPDPPKAQQAPSLATRREHNRILAAYGGAYDDPKLQVVISRTVDKLVAASDRPDLRYHVTLLNSPAINAFALPSGELYITRGLVALANDTSELASVLAHEMSHIIARHAAIREDQARRVALVSAVVNEVLTDPDAGARALAKSKIALSSFSRAQEFEADRIGVGIAARAGYDPYGAVRFLSSMGRNADLKAPVKNPDTRPVEFLSSHPATPDRIRNARNNARGYTAPGPGIRDKGDYLAALDGMVYGEDPNEGYVRGRRFLHPKLGFTFMAPDGFSMENTAQALLGVKADGKSALRLDVVRVPAEQSLSDYLASGWLENIDRNSIKNTVIGGFRAATAVARGTQWSFRLYAIRFGSDVFRFIYASKQLTPAVDRAFSQSIETFRRLTLAEIDATKPLRLALVMVKPGDTAERLARRMTIDDRGAKRFRVLNGLGPREQPKVGDQVKIVVE